MKLLLIIISIFALPVTALAQTDYNPLADQELTGQVMRSAVILILLYLCANFILTVIKMILNYRLKKTILEKRVDENIVASLLPDQHSTALNGAVKAFILLLGIGIGLTIISFFPLGIHSLIIMVFCLSLSFLVYYYSLKSGSKK